MQAQLADLTDDLDPNIRRQSEIAAEDKVVEALVAEGFPLDRIERIGHLKLGFDIRAHRIDDEATGEISVKRIEVKGRLRGQPVRLTTNEWYKANNWLKRTGSMWFGNPWVIRLSLCASIILSQSSTTPRGRSWRRGSMKYRRK